MATPGGKKLVVALDASAGSTEALGWALDNVVNAAEDHLVLVTIRPSTKTFLAGQPGFHVSSAEAQDETTQKKLDGLKVLQKYKDICDAKKVSSEMRVVLGDARLAICEVADEIKADAVVVGSRGHGAIKRLVLGSVSEYCVNNCNCPVIVVRPNTIGTPEQIAPIV